MATHGTKCIECYVWNKKYQERKRDKSEKTVFEQRREQGACAYCGRPVVDGKRLCAEHYAVRLTDVKRLHEHPNTKRAQREFVRRLLLQSGHIEMIKR